MRKVGPTGDSCTELTGWLAPGTSGAECVAEFRKDAEARKS